MAEKVLVAMSGGVDSSVAAYLLQQQGYACIGVTMRLYENETAGIPRGHTCCSLDDVEDARAVAYDLGMPYYVLNLRKSLTKKSSANLCRSTRTAAPQPLALIATAT